MSQTHVKVACRHSYVFLYLCAVIGGDGYKEFKTC
jgi:hypothetical protein